MAQSIYTTFVRMTSFSGSSIVLTAAVLTSILAGVCAYEDFGGYLIPDTDGYYPLDKRSYNPHCRRCMSGDYGWENSLSCYKCWERRSAPYYGGKKKRGYSTRPGHIVPYYGKRAAADMGIFPEEDLDLQAEKRSSLFKCTCCMRTEDPGCCSECNAFFDEKRDEKRGYVTSFADFGNDEEGCGCCQRGFFSLSCCFRCLQSKK